MPHPAQQIRKLGGVGYAKYGLNQRLRGWGALVVSGRPSPAPPGYRVAKLARLLARQRLFSPASPAPWSLQLLPRRATLRLNWRRNTDTRDSRPTRNNGAPKRRFNGGRNDSSSL